MDVIPTTDALDEPTVMRQIRKLVEITDQNIQEFADIVNEGTYKSVSVTGPVNGMYTLNFVNQNDETESFNFLIKDIKNITSSQSGSTVTLTLTYSNNTTQTFTWTAGGDVTTNTVQTISAVKTFTVSPIVPDTPSGVHAGVNQAYVESTVDGVNNLLHKSANETKIGILTLPNMGIDSVYVGGSIERWVRVCYSAIGDFAMIGAIIPEKFIQYSEPLSLFGFQIRNTNGLFNIIRLSTTTVGVEDFALTYDGANYELWYHYTPSGSNARVMFSFFGGNNRGYTSDGITEKVTLNPEDYTIYINPTVIL